MTDGPVLRGSLWPIGNEWEPFHYRQIVIWAVLLSPDLSVLGWKITQVDFQVLSALIICN